MTEYEIVWLIRVSGVGEEKVTLPTKELAEALYSAICSNPHVQYVTVQRVEKETVLSWYGSKGDVVYP